jgi:hypothetical protein
MSPQFGAQSVKTSTAAKADDKSVELPSSTVAPTTHRDPESKVTQATLPHSFVGCVLPPPAPISQRENVLTDAITSSLREAARHPLLNVGVMTKKVDGVDKIIVVIGEVHALSASADKLCRQVLQHFSARFVEGAGSLGAFGDAVLKAGTRAAETVLSKGGLAHKSNIDTTRDEAKSNKSLRLYELEVGHRAGWVETLDFLGVHRFIGAGAAAGGILALDGGTYLAMGGFLATFAIGTLLVNKLLDPVSKFGIGQAVAKIIRPEIYLRNETMGRNIDHAFAKETDLTMAVAQVGLIHTGGICAQLHRLGWRAVKIAS